MKKCKKILALSICAVMAFSLFGCGGNTANSSKKEKVVIAYQSSVAYAPLLVMQEKKMVEEAYGKDIEVEWKLMDNGSAINDGITSGDIDVGAMGVSPAVTGVMKGIPYKIAFGLSAQPYSVMTNDKNIKTLKDIGKKDQIAITQVNSQPHILLAKAAKAVLGDAHALDSQLTVLSNPDGYSAIVSGAVKNHMIISPYNFMEENSKEKEIHEVEVPKDVWGNKDTFIVGMVSNKLKNDKPEVYKALCEAVEKSMKFINANSKETAEILKKGYDEASVEDIEKWITDPRSDYSTKLTKVMDTCKFMQDEKFIEKAPTKLSEIAYENVKGN